MICYHCKRALPDGAAFCKSCGAKQDITPALFAAAKNGSDAALSDLYERTYDSVYHTIRSVIKDEDTILDLTQDTFVRAFQRLDSVEDPAKFRPWVKTIARNLAIDHVRAKKPMLFSQMTADEDAPAPEFEDDRPEHLPDVVIDRKETTRLLNEMLSTLSEDQRMAIGLYYYEELSVREIAEQLGVSENTVKSRLFQGRKKIETQVRDLEKRGTKLYSFSPIILLLLLLRNAENIPAPGASPEVWANISRRLSETASAAPKAAAGKAAAGKTAAKATAGKAAGAAAAKAASGAGKALALKIIAAAAALALVGSAAAIVLHARSAKHDVPAESAAPAQQQAPAASAEPEPEEDPYREVYESYLEFIERNETPLRAYNWQLGRGTEPRNIAICDIAGDDAPELIVMRAEGTAAMLSVYGNKGGDVRLLYESDRSDPYSVFSYSDVTGAPNFAVYQTAADKHARFVTVFGDEEMTRSVGTLAENANGTLATDTVSRAENMFDSAVTYAQNGSPIDASRYEALMEQYADKPVKLLMYNQNGKDLPDSIDGAEDISMTYDEAVAFLRGAAGEAQSAPAAQDDTQALLDEIGARTLWSYAGTSFQSSLELRADGTLAASAKSNRYDGIDYSDCTADVQSVTKTADGAYELRITNVKPGHTPGTTEPFGSGGKIYYGSAPLKDGDVIRFYPAGTALGSLPDTLQESVTQLWSDHGLVRDGKTTVWLAACDSFGNFFEE